MVVAVRPKGDVEDQRLRGRPVPRLRPARLTGATSPTAGRATEGLPLVFYTHRPPDDGPSLLRELATIAIAPGGGTPDADAIAAQARDAAALCFFVPDVIDAALLARLPRLKVAAGFGKGVDNVDVAAATERGIWVTNVPDALTDATADLVWALLLGLARNVVRGDATVRSGAFQGWHPHHLLGAAVSGATLGLIGFGRIGQAVARRAAGFAMRVQYTDRVRAAADVEAACNATSADRATVLRTSDFVVVLVPLTDATRGLIGATELALMPPGARLINAARGSVVDEAAVAAALAAGTLAGYASDVFAFEDKREPDRPHAIDPALLADRERTVFTPHLGTAVAADRRNLAIAQASAVADVLRGLRPRGAVNEPQSPR